MTDRQPSHLLSAWDRAQRDGDEMTPFLAGFMDASSLTARKSPFETGSAEDAEYHRGYSRSMEECGR